MTSNTIFNPFLSQRCVNAYFPPTILSGMEFLDDGKEENIAYHIIESTLKRVRTSFDI